LDVTSLRDTGLDTAECSAHSVNTANPSMNTAASRGARSDVNTLGKTKIVEPAAASPRRAVEIARNAKW
jgi:hypothetical protein